MKLIGRKRRKRSIISV